MTEKRPTLDPLLGTDVELVLVDTWKRPTVVDWLAGSVERGEAPLTTLVSLTPLVRGDDLWRVFSGLEGGEEDEEEDDEEVEVEDGVRDEEETMQEGSGTLLEAPSEATDTWERRQQKFNLTELDVINVYMF